MSVPGFNPRIDEYGGRKGDRTSASFLSRTQDELYAARSGAVSHPLMQENGPAGSHISLDRETLDLRRFILAEDLESGSYAEAKILLYNGTTGLWDREGERFDVHDSFGKDDGSVRLQEGAVGFAKWFNDNGLWEFVQIGDIISNDFFPARLDCRVSSSGTWVFSWVEMEYTSALAAASVLTGGRKGYPAQTVTVTKTTTGDGSTAEVETVTICGPPLIGGTWTLTGYMSATPYTTSSLAYTASSSDVQSALRALNSSSFPAVTVTGSMSAGFVVTWPSTGTVSTMFGTATGLLPLGPASPACEINNHKAAVSIIVWMKRVYRPSSPAVVVITKTASGNSAGVAAAFSLYLDQVMAGSFTVTVDGSTTAAIPYGSTAAQIRTAIGASGAGVSVSSFGGSGTIGAPWTFTVTTNTADHTLTADGSGLIDGSGYRFQSDWPNECALAATIVTNVEWDVVTCALTKTTDTLGNLLGC